MNYGKSISMVVATVISAIVAALTGDEFISNVEWVNIIVIGLGAVSVVIVPNLNVGIAVYAKGIIAFFTAVLTLAVSLMSAGMTMSEWLQLLIAGLAAIGVVALPAPKHQLVPQPGTKSPLHGPA